MDWVGRIWGYTGAGGAVQGFAAGYFLWDLIASIVHYNVLGWGSLAHAISALLVTSLGFVSYFICSISGAFYLLVKKQLADFFWRSVHSQTITA
jgi:hypothetical protein